MHPFKKVAEGTGRRGDLLRLVVFEYTMPWFPDIPFLLFLSLDPVK